MRVRELAEQLQYHIDRGRGHLEVHAEDESGSIEIESAVNCMDRRTGDSQLVVLGPVSLVSKFRSNGSYKKLRRTPKKEE